MRPYDDSKETEGKGSIENLEACAENETGALLWLAMLLCRPKQREELHGVELDSLNSNFTSVSTTDSRVSQECNEVISQASYDRFWFLPKVLDKIVHNQI